MKWVLGLLVVGLLASALASGLPAASQRADPVLSQLCFFNLNGTRLCLVKHLEFTGLDAGSQTLQARAVAKGESGEVRIVTGDFSQGFRMALFGLLNRKQGPIPASIVFLNTSLHESGRIEFGDVSLREIEMPEMNAKSNAKGDISFRLAVSNVTRPTGAPPTSPPPARNQTASRQDPEVLLKFLFRLNIDGLNTAFIPDMGKLRIQPSGATDFSFVVRGVTDSNGFLGWTGAKSASIEYLNASLKSFFKIGFTITKKRLTEEFDSVSGERTLRVEAACSGFQAAKG